MLPMNGRSRERGLFPVTRMLNGEVYHTEAASLSMEVEGVCPMGVEWLPAGTDDEMR